MYLAKPIKFQKVIFSSQPDFETFHHADYWDLSMKISACGNIEEIKLECKTCKTHLIQLILTVRHVDDTWFSRKPSIFLEIKLSTLFILKYVKYFKTYFNLKES